MTFIAMHSSCGPADSPAVASVAMPGDVGLDLLGVGRQVGHALGQVLDAFELGRAIGQAAQGFRGGECVYAISLDVRQVITGGERDRAGGVS